MALSLTSSMSLASTTSSNRAASASYPSYSTITCSRDQFHDQERNCNRRPLLLGVGALSLSLLSATPLLAAEGVPDKYQVFVDKADGYSYYYPSDWREFDFMAHDSAFKDRYLQLQNVRLSFIPTTKSDIHEMGPLKEVVYHLVNHVYSTPTQVADIMDMQEKNVDGKNYYTFEYVLTSPNFSRASFATIAVGNGMFFPFISLKSFAYHLTKALDRWSQRKEMEKGEEQAQSCGGLVQGVVHLGRALFAIQQNRSSSFGELGFRLKIAATSSIFFVSINRFIKLF